MLTGMQGQSYSFQLYDVDVKHLILSSRPSEGIELSFFAGKIIIRIENAFMWGKTSSSNFPNPKTSVVRHASIVNYNNKIHPKRVSRFRRAIFWL
jgi:hypothetical protein